MRIAYIINQYPAVSHSFIRREIQALERRGFEITRISLRGWDQELADSEDLNERNRTRYVLKNSKFALVFTLLRLLINRPVCFARALALACRMGFRAERPLLIHLAYLIEACLIEFWLRKENVSHIHAHFGTNSAEVAMFVRALGGPPWSFTVHGPKEFEKPDFIGLREKIRRCAFVVAISSYGRSQLYRLTNYTEWRKVHVVHCGLDRAFYAASENSTNLSRRLVCVGRLCEQKGQLLLLDAASRLLGQNVNFELVLAGDGEMREEIETLIAQCGLKEHIRITGWVSNAKVRDEILAARALVLPSFAEGLPVVVMEAMALRRPVISTYVAGIPELVTQDETGWLVPAGDVEALGNAMLACLDESPDGIRRMGKSAYIRVLKRHDVDVEAAKLAALFREDRQAETSRA